jgi:hypothetical protein
MLAPPPQIVAPAGTVGIVLATGLVLVIAGLALAAVVNCRWLPTRGHRSPSRLAAHAPLALANRAAPGIVGRAADASVPELERKLAGPARRPAHGPTAPAVVLEPGPRQLPDRAVVAFGRTLERSRRLLAAEERMARELADLAGNHWLVERYVVLAGRRVPFIVAGPTGVFLLCATDGAWDVHDLVGLSRLSARAQERLPGYRGRVHAGVCMVFDEQPPRTWYAGLEHDGHGGWVLGLDWLQRWLYNFDSAAGPDAGDISALLEAAGPIWHRRTTARLPRVRNFG